MDADAGRGLHPEFAVWTLLAVGQLGPGGLKLHEYVVRGVVQQFALLGENESAGVAVKQRHAEFLFERRNLPRHRRLRQSELFAGMGKAAGVGGRVKDLEFVPIHAHPLSHSAATAGSASPCAARERSASSAAMQPWPGAGAACPHT